MNSNKVPKKIWSKWSKVARVVFNRTYKFLISNQSVMIHPKTPKIKPFEWKTIAWNAAWIAADAVDNTIPDEVV